VSILAEYESTCPVCLTLIEIGDLVVRENGEWVHDWCSNEDSDE
jgi:hypothetical protein